MKLIPKRVFPPMDESDFHLVTSVLVNQYRMDNDLVNRLSQLSMSKQLTDENQRLCSLANERMKAVDRLLRAVKVAP